MTSGATNGPQEFLEQLEAAYNRANEDYFAISYLITDEQAALQVTKQSEGGQGTRRNGQKAGKELASKYLKMPLR